jgi:hypothetical protein
MSTWNILSLGSSFLLIMGAAGVGGMMKCVIKCNDERHRLLAMAGMALSAVLVFIGVLLGYLRQSLALLGWFN